MIAVVDLKISNLASVLHALRLVGSGDYLLARPENISSAAAVILPGVGAFADGMVSLHEQGLFEPIRRVAMAGTPIFGICLGMQLLASQQRIRRSRGAWLASWTRRAAGGRSPGLPGTEHRMV